MLTSAKKGRKKLIWPLEMLLFVLLVSIVWSFQILLFPLLERTLPSAPTAVHLLRISLTGGILILLSLLMTRCVEQRPLTSLGFLRKGALREYLLGALIGFALITLCVLLGVICGVVELAQTSASPLLLILYFFAFLLQGAGEELFCRGYFMISVTRNNSTRCAVLLSSLLFAYMHLGNHGIGLLPLINIALFGLLMAFYLLKRGSIWGICAMHSLWNFMQGCVFGISVSGTGAGASPLTETLSTDAAWLSGGTFGIEGGLLTSAVLLLALFVIPYLPTPKNPLK